ncbi:MAG: ABC transporter ATP-binding protein [Chloroflexaceae bacterium]|nr:ABC transporter ATP-binding protein [Chloroflexaceae bacterium]
MTNTSAISTEALRKEYGSNVAVADLTLDVPRGEIFGFLGPNGAGKSTSVKMLLGLVQASSGQAQVLGTRPGTPATMRQIGFLPEHFRFPEWLQAGELLDLHGRLAGLDSATRRRRSAEVLELVGLSEQRTRPLSGFSKGMLQRIGLAQALIAMPALVFLDEPTSALDPFGRMLVRGIIRELKQQGTTVFLNSHLLGEVEATCDRVAFIKQGRVLHTMPLDSSTTTQLVVELRVGAAPPALLAMLEQFTGNAVQIQPPDTATIPTNGTTTLALLLADPTQLPALAQHVIAHGAHLYALTPRRTSLEERFLEIIGTSDSGQ